LFLALLLALLSVQAPESCFRYLQLGQVDILDGSGMCSNDEGEVELREQMITKHYTGRVAELMSQLQHADSKALHFYAEVRLC
jgi:Predicted coiled-coil domain-containing protein